METRGPSLKIYKSSAGSGKTYQLVLNYLSIILKSNNPEKFKRILAITFTNKAAQEMKIRVIEGLRKLKKGKDETFLQDYQAATGIPTHELSIKAEKLLTLILHNYGHLNILTIDKFVHKIIRSFSRELGLTTNFELTFDFENIASRCIDSVLQELGNDEHLTKILVEYYQQLIDLEDDPNIERALQERTKILRQEGALEKLDFYKDKDLTYFVRVREEAKSKIKNLKAEIHALVEEAKDILGTNFHELKNGNSKYFLFLENIISSDNNLKLLTESQVKNIKLGKWISQKAEKENPELAETLSTQGNRLQHVFLTVNHMIQQISFLKNLDKNLMSFALLNDVQQHINQFKKDNNIVLIEELNQIISDIIGKEPAPYIYEKIGARFENYFIDEFQDTSTLQWQNLIPLIHDSLSSGHENLIVGDAKQSIYRWRGGNAQQFIDLPQIDVQVANLEDANQSFKNSYHGFVLNDNYRSSKSVIEFNNWLFPDLANRIDNDAIHPIYEDVVQYAQRTDIGHVEVSILRKDQYANPIPFAENLLRQIQECQQDGYHYGSICILTRTNKQGVEISEFLLSQNIPVTSQESLLLKESEHIKRLHAFMKTMYRPTEENIIRLFVHFEGKDLMQLFETYRIPEESNQFYNTGYDFQTFLDTELPNFSSDHFYQLSTFDQVDYLVDALQIPRNDIYTDKLLNAVFDFQQHFGHQTLRFMEYFEEKIMNSSVAPPETGNAIKVMTIHKSKGLQFPVVLIPMKIDDQNRQESLWLSGQVFDELGLSEVNMSANKDAMTPEVQEIHDAHSALSTIDLLNMIYVAYTRPEDRLYIQYYEDRAGAMVKNQINLVENHPDFNPDLDRLVFGKREHVKETYRSEKTVFQLSRSNKKNWREMLVLATPKTVMDAVDDTYSERNWGIAIHEILQKIEQLSESQFIINQFLKHKKEWLPFKEQIKNIIQMFAQNENIQQLFGDANRIYSERSLGTSFERELRPDKVIEKDHEIIVMDFKTGDPLKKHHQQILEYGHILSKMYSRPIKMYLIYLSADKITIQHV